MVISKGKTLGIVSAMYAFRHDAKVYIHLSFGRVIDRLSARFDKVLLCVPIRDAPPPESRDYQLKGDNIEMIPQPFYTSSVGALKHPVGITRAYARVCSKADTLFFRGMVPYVGLLYLLTWFLGKTPCHWLVGNPIALLRSHRRAGRIADVFSLAYAFQDRILTRLGRWMTGGGFICNGEELGRVYRSPRTAVTVSSTITDDEFFEREDTCDKDKVRVLFVGFVRPEKGLEYLIEALGKLRTQTPWELVIVGPTETFPAYREKLDRLIGELSMEDRVRWEGYVPYGPKMWRYLRECDIFVLPTLSEGTPRVLVEARANGIPVVASNVGGIPTSVTDGVDGLLVPPKDSDALGAGIQRIIEDERLRRSLIREGLKSARKLTIDRFIESVVDVLEER